MESSSSAVLSDGDAQRYKYFMNAIALVNTLFTSFAVFLIVKHTPNSMKNYRWFLLNMTMCCYALDFYVGVVFVPYPMFPVIGTCPLGLTGLFGWRGAVFSWSVLNIMLGSGAISLICALAFRLSIVHASANVLMRWRSIALMALLHLFYTTPSIVMHAMAVPDEGESFRVVEKENPLIAPFYKSHACAKFSIGMTPLYRYAAVAMAEVFVAMCCAGFLVMAIFRGLEQLRSQMHSKTYRMHRSLTISLLLQFAIPSGFMLLPYVFFTYVALIQPPNAHPIACATFLLSATHSTANVIVLVAVTRPYRNATVEIVKAVIGRKPIERYNPHFYTASYVSRPQAFNQADPQRRRSSLRPPDGSRSWLRRHTHPDAKGQSSSQGI